MSDEVFVEETPETTALNVVISLLQQISTLMQQAVDALRALREWTVCRWRFARNKWIWRII